MSLNFGLSETGFVAPTYEELLDDIESDFQTKFGKTPYGVAKATKKVAPNAPVIVLAGNVGEKIDSLYSSDAMDAIFATPAGAKSLKDAMADGAHDIALTAENIARLINVIS